MSIVTLAEAKLHLRVDHSDEDTLIQTQIEAAELSVVHWLDRNIYADSTALNTATSSAPAALSTATTAYDAAMTASESISNDIEREAAVKVAEDAYQSAIQAHRRTMRGLVMNQGVKAAVLLMVGHLYANREAVVTVGMPQTLPMGVQFMLQPFGMYA